MRRHIIMLAAAILAICGTAAATAPKTGDFERLMTAIRGDFRRNPQPAAIEKALRYYNDADGSFTDVDYASIHRTAWSPMTHVRRIYDFAFAYTDPRNEFYGDDGLFDKIVRGLEYWHERDPWCHNWWYNQIAEPQALGILLIQMRAGKRQLPAELEAKLLERMEQDGGHPAQWTGANRTDIALHWIYRACLTLSDTTLRTAVESVYSTLEYTTEEGFQHDDSYFQHGRQLYIGGYGDDILKGITQVAMYTKGTDYALPQDKLELLSRFMRRTYYPTIRGRHMLFDVLGRGVSRPGNTDKSHTALFARRMTVLDTAHAEEYRAIIDRLEGEQPAGHAITPMHNHYFRGDYTLHVRPGYTFDVRMVSTRTMRCEYGNGENLKTYFMSDGCTNIVTDGDEYYGIFPVWDWRRIPGVTAPQLKEIPKTTVDWQTPGTSRFAGGVSDSLYGVSAYAYRDDFAGVNTGARKAWFFFDDEVVCLGAGISSSADATVFTTVDQCLADEEKPPLIGKGKDVTSLQEGTRTISAPDWILHGDVAYLFPLGGNIEITRRRQEGNWQEINRTASRRTVRKEVFTLGIDHGLHPDEADYAYIVVPGKSTAKEIERYRRQGDVEIVSDTPQLQAVTHRSLGISGAVFYSAGKLRLRDITIETDRACALMLRCADPGQTGSEITVRITRGEKSRSVSCDFRDSGIYAGATKTYDISLK